MSGGGRQGGGQQGTPAAAAAAGRARRVAGAEKEAVFGVVPVLKNKRIYGFMDAFLVLSGYNIATWSYTTGSYLSTLVGFRQIVIGVVFGSLLMMGIYQLPNILSARYGIDIWVWLRAVFGRLGIKVMIPLIILVNYPWYAVSADMFASSMANLGSLYGLETARWGFTLLAILCVVLGTMIAYRGLGMITWATRILVPLLLAVGVMVVVIGFRSATFEAILAYRPPLPFGTDSVVPYILSVEGNFAFVITLIGGMGELPRLTKTERGGYWSSVLSQGISGAFFVVVGAVMAIATQQVTGEMVDDPTMMLAKLAAPSLAVCSLLLVAFANIGTQAVGAYIYGVVLKSSFPRANYRFLIIILMLYVCGLCAWGRLLDYFGAFLTLSACVYAPLAGLLLVDFFLVRKQRFSLRSAYGLPGHTAYEYTGGFNWVGLACVCAGIAMSLLVYNPVTGEIHNRALFTLTPTGFSLLGTGVLYYGLSRIRPVRAFLLRDRGELSA
ncbi:MAG: cytosine permease [Clostridiales Family XIII bacterium]|jgi:NCS1 family nucleobase:cation symporter-1|nr:cytosine permease [Clostridiales Family XIII bacterium]